MTRSLRVLSVCRHFPTPVDPAAGIFVLNRVEAMSRHAEVEALQPVPHFPLLAPLPGWAKAASHRPRSLEIRHAPMFYVPAILKRLDARWLARAVRGPAAATHRRRPLDLIDAHFGYPDGAGCVRIGRELGLPVFITIRGFEHEYVKTPEVGAQMVRALQEADGCVAVSQALGELAIAHGVPRERVRVVHNAVDSGMFRHLDRDEARLRLGLDPGLRLVVSVGQLIARKRHHVLIEAFAQVLARQPGARLAIIGGGSLEPEYPRRLRDLAERLGVAGSVDFHGNLEPAAVAEWLAAADVFALATAREGCCNAVLEALATGLPVVTTPVGDNAHFVRGGDNGLLVPVDDAGAMAEALAAALAGGIAMRRETIAAALERQVGGWDAVALRVLEFFGERLDARRGAAGERVT